MASRVTGKRNGLRVAAQVSRFSRRRPLDQFAAAGKLERPAVYPNSTAVGWQVPLFDVSRIMQTLISERNVQQGVLRLAADIANTYGDAPLTIVGVLTGSIVLLADIIRQLTMPLRVGVVQASSYREGTARRSLIINSNLMLDIANQNTLIVDDIFDTGHTMMELIAMMEKLGPTSIRTAVLLKKKDQQQVDFEPDFVAFDIPNKFVVGYGLDYRDEYRNLPYVASLEPTDFEL